MMRFIMIFHPFLQTRSSEPDALSAEVLPGAVHDTSLVFLPLGGHRVLPHNEIQARVQPDCSSFLHRRPARDTQGL